MRCGILGPLEVIGEHGPVDINGRKRRALLTYLLLHRQQPVALDQIVDDLWDSAGPTGAGATVQTYVSQLRRIFDPAKIERQPAGYVLHLADEALDAARFEQLSHDVRVSDDPQSQLDLADAALALWRATPLLEFAGAPWADVPSARLTSLRANLVEQRVSALLALGRHAETVAPLEAMVAETPFDERFWAQLVLALYRCERQGDALRALSRVRQILAEELGVQPGAELRELERRVLDQDPVLAPPPVAARPARISTAAPAASIAEAHADADAAAAASRPSGVVTFVLTDLVDSTALWDTQPDAMAEAVARHEELVADAIKSAGGEFLKSRGEGDSTMSVFERASDAIVAARAIVDKVAAEPWPVDPPLTVRVAVHTGEALLRNGDYFGGALNRAARLRSLAGSNEVLCSRVTAELVAEALPTGTQLVDRGTTELRGLRRPEVLFALVDAEYESRRNGSRPAPTGPRFSVLGPVVCRDGEIASLPERRLLTRLLVDRNRVVREEDLFDALWDDAPPARARNSLQSKISRLRGIVGGEVIQHVDDGYRLRADADDCDADQFEAHWESALAETADEASLGLLDQALAAWRGPAFGEFSDAPFARAAAARLETTRRSAEDRRLELVGRLRPADEVLWESEKLLSVDPFRESAWVMRLRMLASCGRRVEALRAFHEYRERLADETGLTPSPSLLAIERELLEGETPAPPTTDGVRQTATAPFGPVAATVVRRGIPWTGPLLPNRDLAGRVRELQTLDDRLGAARRGDGRIVIVSGEAGIGKTRLLDEVAAHATSRGMTVIRGSAVGARVAPLGALRAAAATVGTGLDVPPASTDEAIDPAAASRRWSSHALALADAIVARAASEPTLLAIDDVHAIDDVSLTTLELVQGTIADAPPGTLHLVMVATYRSIGTPEDLLARIERFVRTPNGSELRLAGLDEPAIVQLVAGAAGLNPTPALVDRLGEAAGNPLVALALLQSLADARALALRDGALDVVDDVAARVPSDLREVVSSLLGGVDASTRGAIARLALLGDGIELTTLRDATGWSDDVAGEVLERGERAGVLRVDLDRVVFVHDLVRWTLVQSLPGASRRRMHREMAEALARTTEPDDAPRVALLADQLRLSGDRRREARVGYWSELAAEQCLARAMWQDAIRHYDAAVDATDTDDARRLELRVRAGMAAFHHHDPARARDRLLPVIESPDVPLHVVGAAVLVLHRAAAFTPTNDAGLVGRTSDALLEFVERAEGDPALAGLRARAFALLSEVASSAGDSSEGLRLVEQARRAAPESDDDALASIEFSAGLAELTALRTAPARTHFARSVELEERAADPWRTSATLGRMALATAYSGDLRAASKVLDEAFEFGHALRFWAEMALVQAVAASVHLLRRDLDASLSAAEDAIRYCERTSYQFAPGLAFPALAAAYAELNETEAAEDALRRWRTTVPGGQTIFEMALRAKTGDVDGVRTMLRRRPLRPISFDSVSMFRLPVVSAAAGVALALSLDDVLVGLLPVIDTISEHGVLAILGWPAFLPALGAEIAAALGEPDADQRAEFATNAARHLGLG